MSIYGRGGGRMKQYLELLKTIKEKGTYKPPAREGMPGTQSLFGYQFRHDLSEGFPLLTTKKMFWKGIVVELLWFLRGDTNIKYLVDNGVNIWNEDAYNYYIKLCKKQNIYKCLNFKSFIDLVKENKTLGWEMPNYYKLGDCGYQYGKVWRAWQIDTVYKSNEGDCRTTRGSIDQIKNLIEGLKKNPESRRHIVTAWDPAHDQDLALTWCHAMFQFNCRPVEPIEMIDILRNNGHVVNLYTTNVENQYKEANLPKYYLDCQLYQRSADAVLGVPFNIASYALLIHIICKIVNMIPGEFIHTFGDVHIYDNHKEAVEEQLSRTPEKLPELVHMKTDEFWKSFTLDNITHLDYGDFLLQDYNPQPSIKAELSTGLKK